jgi:parallel beta-helix repeat protein
MNSKTKKISFLLVIGFVLPLILNYNVNFSNNNNLQVVVPKESAGYNESFIHIDASIPNNWTWTVGNESWCYGDGSWANPYTIENVTIDASGSPTGSGILIENSKNDYFIIRNCTVINAGTGSYDAGIRLENTCNGTINDNYCMNNERFGIILYLSCNNNTLSGNTANNNILYGIYIVRDCHQNTVINNTANNNKEGITLYWWGFPGVTNNSIINNIANNNSENGIHSSSCSQNNYTGNTANDNERRGFFLEGSNLNDIIDNTAYRNGYHGISLFNSADDNTLINNTSEENKRYGIEVYNSDSNEIINNKANRNGDTGLYLSWGFCDSNNITENDINDNVKIGILLKDGCDNNNINNNTINRNNLGIGLKDNSNYNFR